MLVAQTGMANGNVFVPPSRCKPRENNRDKGYGNRGAEATLQHSLHVAAIGCFLRHTGNDRIHDHNRKDQPQ